MNNRIKALLFACFALGMVGCVKKETHTHTYSVKYDTTSHWQECECQDKIDVEKHEFNEVVTTPATCTTKGLKTFTCDCGYSYTEEIPMTNHNYAEAWSYDETNHWHACECGDKKDEAAHSFTSAVTTEATHNSEGVRTYTCECGYSYTEVIPAVEHNYAEAWSTNENYHWHECSCGAKKDEAGHDYTEWKYNETKHWKECVCGETAEEEAHNFTSAVTTEPTHTTKGVRTYTCECGYSYTEEIDAVEHNYAEVWSHDETNHWHECECGAKKDEAAHSFTSAVTTEPTHTTKGVRTYTCECGYSYTEEIDAIEHNFAEAWSHDATNHWHECSCGAKKDEAAHNFTSEVTVAATCTTDGVRTYTCDCGYSYTEVIPAAHSYAEAWSHDATNHWHECSCGAKGDEAAHEFTSEVTVAATCTTDGVRTYTCECGYSYTEVIPAAHSYAETLSHDETGHWYECTVCGAKKAETDHSFTSAVTTEATCTTKGVRTYTCECGYSYTEEIDYAHTCKAAAWNKITYASKINPGDKVVFTYTGTDKKIYGLSAKNGTPVELTTVDGVLDTTGCLVFDVVLGSKSQSVAFQYPGESKYLYFASTALTESFASGIGSGGTLNTCVSFILSYNSTDGSFNVKNSTNTPSFLAYDTATNKFGRTNTLSTTVVGVNVYRYDTNLYRLPVAGTTDTVTAYKCTKCNKWILTENNNDYDIVLKKVTDPTTLSYDNQITFVAELDGKTFVWNKYKGEAKEVTITNDTIDYSDAYLANVELAYNGAFMIMNGSEYSLGSLNTVKTDIEALTWATYKTFRYQYTFTAVKDGDNVVGYTIQAKDDEIKYRTLTLTSYTSGTTKTYGFNYTDVVANATPINAYVLTAVAKTAQ